MTYYFIKEIKDEKRWNIKCILICSYHQMRGRTNGNGKRGSKWRISDTSKELDLSMGYVSESIMLADNLGTYPNLKFMSRDGALRFLRNL